MSNKRRQRKQEVEEYKFVDSHLVKYLPAGFVLFLQTEKGFNNTNIHVMEIVVMNTYGVDQMWSTRNMKTEDGDLLDWSMKSKKQIALFVGKSEDTVQRTFKKLREHGMLVEDITRVGKKNTIPFRAIQIPSDLWVEFEEWRNSLRSSRVDTEEGDLEGCTADAPPESGNPFADAPPEFDIPFLDAPPELGSDEDFSLMGRALTDNLAAQGEVLHLERSSDIGEVFSADQVHSVGSETSPREKTSANSPTPPPPIAPAPSSRPKLDEYDPRRVRAEVAHEFPCKKKGAVVRMRCQVCSGCEQYENKLSKVLYSTVAQGEA